MSVRRRNVGGHVERNLMSEYQSGSETLFSDLPQEYSAAGLSGLPVTYQCYMKQAISTVDKTAGYQF